MTPSSVAANEKPEKVVTAVYAHRRAATTCGYLLPYVETSASILDAGCGPGSITLDLARLVAGGYVLGIDTNQASLEKARVAANEQGVHNVTFQQGDATRLTDLKDDTFDIVHAHQVLLHVPDPLAALKEMRRVLKPGGVFACCDMASQTIVPNPPGIQKASEAVDRMYSARGADRFIGQKTHIIANHAGFDWENIIVGVDASQLVFGKEEREKFALVASERFRSEMISGGFASETECDEHSAAWRKWSILPEARVMGLSGTLICHK